MEDGASGEDIRKQAAIRYGAWLQEQMDRKGWKAATVARRSGLKKQTIGQILRGDALQPTAWQIAALARTFSVPPGEIFTVMGYWNDDNSADMPADLLARYRALNFPGRRALLSTARVIEELQTEYSAMVRNEDELDTERGDRSTEHAVEMSKQARVAGRDRDRLDALEFGVPQDENEQGVELEVLENEPQAAYEPRPPHWGEGEDESSPGEP